MEKGTFNQPSPLEHGDPERTDRIRKIAPYLLFEHLMSDADEGKLSREEAIERMRALTPIVVEGEG